MTPIHYVICIPIHIMYIILYFQDCVMVQIHVQLLLHEMPLHCKGTGTWLLIKVHDSRQGSSDGWTQICTHQLHIMHTQ